MKTNRSKSGRFHLDKIFTATPSAPVFLSEKERTLLLCRIAGQMGISDAGVLPYTAGLKHL